MGQVTVPPPWEGEDKGGGGITRIPLAFSMRLSSFPLWSKDMVQIALANTNKV